MREKVAAERVGRILNGKEYSLRTEQWALTLVHLVPRCIKQSGAHTRTLHREGSMLAMLGLLYGRSQQICRGHLCGYRVSNAIGTLWGVTCQPSDQPKQCSFCQVCVLQSCSLVCLFMCARCAYCEVLHYVPSVLNVPCVPTGGVQRSEGGAQTWVPFSIRGGSVPGSSWILKLVDNGIHGWAIKGPKN